MFPPMGASGFGQNDTSPLMFCVTRNVKAAPFAGMSTLNLRHLSIADMVSVVTTVAHVHFHHLAGLAHMIESE